ncbi:hypothetical protein PGQ11_013461 [Apiospora arundinis]|uniref:F-box domain-containing protein n=1 Tax=Apiospora arundinis TaxID=335852 RepID=A0ABR2HPE0_9PEZI
MPLLTELPTEVVNMVLTALGDIDLKSLIVAQSVCTQFRELIETIAFRLRHTQPSESGGLEFDPFLRVDFGSILWALDARRHDQGSLFKRQEHQLGHMLWSLPWAQTAESREPYLRPGASWRRLCVTVGGPPITDLACMTFTTSYFRHRTGQYQEVVMAAPWLTTGCLFDMLLLEDNVENLTVATVSMYTDLLLEQRVAEYNHADHLCRYVHGNGALECPYLAPIYAQDAASRQSAVLKVHVPEGDEQSSYDNLEYFLDLQYRSWRRGGDLCGIRGCEWQGPLPPKPAFPEYPFRGHVVGSDDDDL